ncbi:MAG: flavin reductase [Bacteroidota bacterium]
MPIFQQQEINTWERFYRANFINSLTGFKSASLISTVNESGKTNLGVFSSIVHIGSNPALVGFINRPVKAAPHTLDNIRSTGVYTINHIHSSFIEQAHQASAKYPAEVSEFEAVGLNPLYIKNIAAPFVSESKVRFSVALKQIIPIELNDTFLVIGEVQYIHIDQDIIMTDGFLELEKCNSLCSNGTDGYYETSLVGRYRYAKPGIKTKKL